jgi:hypothetical protein
MGKRGEAVAQEVEAANAELRELAAGLSPEQWAAQTEEGWTVLATARHVAGAEGVLLERLLKPYAEGQPSRMPTGEALHEGNAAFAKRYASGDPAAVFASLDKNGPAAAEFLRQLPDEAFDRVTPSSRQWTLAQVIENVYLGHIRQHTASIRTAVGARARTN